MRNLLLLVLFLFSGIQAGFGQNKDEELASQYYLQGDYRKAMDLYEKLHSKEPSNTYIYTNYLNCFVQLSEFAEARKMVAKQKKRFPKDPSFAVDYAWLYQKEGDDTKSKKEIAKLLDDSKEADYAWALSLALQRRAFQEDAAQALLKARRASEDKALFAKELALLYSEMGKVKELVAEAILTLQDDPREMEAVQGIIQNTLSKEEDWKYLTKELQSVIIKNSEDYILSEMMLWVLVQRKEFSAAFVQFRALDKKKKEHGRRVMQLAGLCMEHGDFENAVRCFEYVEGLGTDKPYFYQAKYGLVDVRYKQITEFGHYTQNDLIAAEKEFQDFIRLYGSFYASQEARRKLARLYTFYLDRPDTAIQILNSIVSERGGQAVFKGETKLELGDCYLMQGEVFDAELTYSQVDKDFKEEALGQEARFRMARLFYFKGEFERSRAYLEVLKTATTQLISNNAIDLSMLIQDNTGLDSTEDAMMRFARAEMLIYRNKLGLGLAVLDTLESIYPGHALSDEILMARAKAGIRENNLDTAAHFLRRVLAEHPKDILADNALFMLAELYRKNLNNPEEAMKLYERMLFEYPGSLYAVEARKQYRALRGDKPDEKKEKPMMFDQFRN